MIKLRKLDECDLATRVEWMNDPRIYASMHFPSPITLESTLEWFYHNRDNDLRLDFAVEEDGILVAMNGLTAIDPVVKKAEAYTMVNPSCKGRGVGTKSKFLKSIYGFKVKKLNKIYSYIDVDNIASIKMCKRIGYRLEGVMRQEVVRGSAFVDRCYLGCLQGELLEDTFEYKIINDEIILFDK